MKAVGLRARLAIFQAFRIGRIGDFLSEAVPVLACLQKIDERVNISAARRKVPLYGASCGDQVAIVGRREHRDHLREPADQLRREGSLMASPSTFPSASRSRSASRWDQW